MRVRAGPEPRRGHCPAPQELRWVLGGRVREAGICAEPSSLSLRCDRHLARPCLPALHGEITREEWMTDSEHSSLHL